MGISASNLSKIAGASASGGGTYIRDGEYAFLIEKVIGEKKFNGETLIVEFFVVRAKPSSDPTVTAPPNPVGSRCSYVINLDKNPSAPGNVKAFLMALMGISDVKDEKEFVDTINEMCGDGQPARGMLIGDETFRKPIQKGPNAGKPFTGHNWKHIPITAEQITANRAILDSQMVGAPTAATPALPETAAATSAEPPPAA